MTTGNSVSVQCHSSSPAGEASPASPPCQFNAWPKKKFRRACCCIAFLLIVNMLLLVLIAHSVGAIMYFVGRGSYTWDDKTWIFQPGGAKTMCNDLCVDLCVHQTWGCELKSCLNSCNDRLEKDGNFNDYDRLPEGEDKYQMVGRDEVLPPHTEKKHHVSGMQKIVKVLEALKKAYTKNCGSNTQTAECLKDKAKIDAMIAEIQVQVAHNGQPVAGIDVAVVKKP